MRPLSEMPRDGIVGICTDIDGTLTEDSSRGQVLSPAAYAAITRAVEEERRRIDVGQPQMLTTGYSSRQRLIIVAHTDRDERIRIISARDVTAAERHDYAEEPR